jgi:hypothetical protein
VFGYCLYLSGAGALFGAWVGLLGGGDHFILKPRKRKQHDTSWCTKLAIEGYHTYDVVWCRCWYDTGLDMGLSYLYFFWPFLDGYCPLATLFVVAIYHVSSITQFYF